MKAIAYNIQPHEKELLTLANGKRHELTLISNGLTDKTVLFAQGKEVVIVSWLDSLGANILKALKEAGVNKIITRSKTMRHIDLPLAEMMGILVVNTPSTDGSPASIARQTIQYLHVWDAEQRISELESDNYHATHKHSGKENE